MGQAFLNEDLDSPPLSSAPMMLENDLPSSCVGCSDMKSMNAGGSYLLFGQGVNQAISRSFLRSRRGHRRVVCGDLGSYQGLSTTTSTYGLILPVGSGSVVVDS